MFICQLSSWHRYVEHNCYISVPAVQTNNRWTSSSHIYLSTIWSVHLPFAVSPTGYLNQANWLPPLGRWQPVWHWEVAISRNSIRLCVYMSKPDHSLRYQLKFLYIVSYNLYHCSESDFEKNLKLHTLSLLQSCSLWLPMLSSPGTAVFCANDYDLAFNSNTDQAGVFQ